MVNGLPVTLEDERPDMLVRSQPVVDDPDKVSLEMTEVKDKPIRFEIHYLGPENVRLEVPVRLNVGKK